MKRVIFECRHRRSPDVCVVCEPPRLLTVAETAAVLGLTCREVGRLAQRGKLLRIRTPGGQSRYYADQVEALAS